MPGGDRFPRRTATPARLLPWLRELAHTPVGLADSYLPGRPLDPTSRQRVIMAVTEVNGCRYCAWIHGSWQAFLGDDGRADAEAALIAYARACAEAGRPRPTSGLDGVLPPEAIRAVRATVAQISLSNLVGNTVDGLVARVTGRRPAQPLLALGEAAVVAAALPVAVPLLTAAGALRTMARLAPGLPVVRVDHAADANLLVHLVAEAVPVLLRNSLVRTVVLGSPMTVNIGIQSGRTAATVRIGRRAVSVENDLAHDCHVVLRGDVESLLRLATGDFSRGLGEVRIRPQ